MLAPAFSLLGESVVPKVVCPDPFLNPLDEENPESCINPCPVQAYKREEYTLMWKIACSLGIIAMVLNLFMAGDDDMSPTPHTHIFGNY